MEQSTEKGVIEILSSVFKLGRLKTARRGIAMTPTSVAIPMPEMGAVYALSVWGCHLIRAVGKPRPEYRIRLRYNPHTFFMSKHKRFTGD